jgi:hypothetical protein
MGTLGAKRLKKNLCGTSFKWCPVHVPYLPYPRYATVSEFVLQEIIFYNIPIILMTMF